MKIGETMA